MGELVQRLNAVVEELHKNEGQLPEADAAAMVFRGVRCFRLVFRKAYGVTYRAYRLEVKLQVAQQLLSETQLSIREISVRLGYATRRKFEQAFKRRYHQTPAQFRSSRKKGTASNEELPLRAYTDNVFECIVRPTDS